MKLVIFATLAMLGIALAMSSEVASDVSFESLQLVAAPGSKTSCYVYTHNDGTVVTNANLIRIAKRQLKHIDPYGPTLCSAEHARAIVSKVF